MSPLWPGNCWQTVCNLKCLCRQHNTVLRATGCSELRFGGREGLNWRVQFHRFCEDSEDRQALPNFRRPSTTKTECFVVSHKISRAFHSYIHTYLHTAWSRVLLKKLTGFSASQEIPRILWNTKVYYRIHQSPPPVRTRSQLGQVHTPHPTSRRSILILSSHLHRFLPIGVFPPGFPTKTL